MPPLIYIITQQNSEQAQKEGAAAATEREDTGPSASTADARDIPIGAKIRVWWRQDKAYFIGVVRSFDVRDDTHEIEYASSGATHWHVLSKYAWELVGDDAAQATEEVADAAAVDEAGEADEEESATENNARAAQVCLFYLPLHFTRILLTI